MATEAGIYDHHRGFNVICANIDTPIRFFSAKNITWTPTGDITTSMEAKLKCKR